MKSMKKNELHKTCDSAHCGSSDQYFFQNEHDFKRASLRYRQWLDHALANTNMGIWDRHPHNGEIVLYESWSELFGFEPHKMQTDELFLQKRIHPEDRPRYINSQNSLYLGLAADFTIEYRIRDRVGKWRWVKDIGRTFEKDRAGRPVFMCGVTMDISKQKEAAIYYQETERRYQSYFSCFPEGAFLFDQKGHFLEVNEATTRISGYPKSHLLNSALPELIAEKNLEQGMNHLSRLIDTGHVSEEILLKKYDGKLIHVVLEAIQLSENAYIGYFKDISEYKRTMEEMRKLEEQLNQAQKMEAIGRLAGGVAHDFNNLLTGIQGYAEIVHDALQVKDPLREDILEIQAAVDKATSLTQQLLTFSRKQVTKPKAFLLNDLIGESKKMVSRLIGEDIQLICKPGPDLWKVKADPHQIDQILMNLVVNSRDAMPNGGNMIIETTNEMLDINYSKTHPELKPGEYVLLSVSDTGCGINKEIRNMVFEPFFTTKEDGKGTGLGLSTVYGIVKQNHGVINVYSEENMGTTFKIYLPRHIGDTEKTKKKEEKHSQNGNETILLVEDEYTVRSITSRMLKNRGYKVFDAPDGEEALQMFNKYKDRIQLLLTDVIMPKMNGMELLEKLQSIKPELKSIFMSGYSESVIGHFDIIEESEYFIQKPFSMEILMQKLRTVLDK